MDISEIEFNVKYNGADPTPEVKRVYVNVLLICPQSISIHNRSMERELVLGEVWSTFKHKFMSDLDVNSTEITNKSEEAADDSICLYRRRILVECVT